MCLSTANRCAPNFCTWEKRFFLSWDAVEGVEGTSALRVLHSHAFSLLSAPCAAFCADYGRILPVFSAFCAEIYVEDGWVGVGRCRTPRGAVWRALAAPLHKSHVVTLSLNVVHVYLCVSALTLHQKQRKQTSNSLNAVTFTGFTAFTVHTFVCFHCGNLKRENSFSAHVSAELCLV